MYTMLVAFAYAIIAMVYVVANSCPGDSDETAICKRGTIFGEDVYVDANTVVEAGCIFGNNITVGKWVRIERGAIIGNYVVVEDGAQIGVAVITRTEQTFGTYSCVSAGTVLHTITGVPAYSTIVTGRWGQQIARRAESGKMYRLVGGTCVEKRASPASGNDESESEGPDKPANSFISPLKSISSANRPRSAESSSFQSRVDADGYGRCKVGISNSIHGTVMCKVYAEFRGGNTITGSLYLGVRAKFQGSSTVIGEMIVGDNSIIRGSSTYNSQVVFGESNIIGGSSTFTNVITGHNVRIGSSNTLTWANLADSSTVGDSCSVFGNLEFGAELRSGSILGHGSTILRSIKVGPNSCIGSGIIVDKDVPAGSYMNQDKQIEYIPWNKIAMMSDGKCSLISRKWYGW